MQNICLSDHYLLSFQAGCNVARTYYKTICYRNLKRINRDNFSLELSHILNNIPVNRVFGDVITNYNDKLSKLMDDHAPVITREEK